MVWLSPTSTLQRPQVPAVQVAVVWILCLLWSRGASLPDFFLQPRWTAVSIFIQSQMFFFIWGMPGIAHLSWIYTVRDALCFLLSTLSGWGTVFFSRINNTNRPLKMSGVIFLLADGLLSLTVVKHKILRKFITIRVSSRSRLIYGHGDYNQNSVCLPISPYQWIGHANLV